MNLIILNFIIVSVAIALMQRSLHSLRLYSFIYAYVYTYIFICMASYIQTLLVLAFYGPFGMCATDLQLMNTDMSVHH